MTNVVSLRSRERHLVGPCHCTECGNEWEASRPAGVTSLECPECYGLFGVPKSEYVPDEFWQCNCGGDLFYLTREGPACRRCGIITQDWVE